MNMMIHFEKHRLEDTMYRHRWKQDDFHSIKQHLTENARQWACFSLELYLVREFDRFLVQLLPIARCIKVQPVIRFHLQCILIYYFSLLMMSFYDEISESISKLQHDFFWLYEDLTMPWPRFSMTSQENTNTKRD